MNIWFANKMTGRYPPLRIVWNILTITGVYAAGALLYVCFLLHAGPETAKDVWKGIF